MTGRCRYLQSQALRRGIQVGLNTVESWNAADSFTFYDKGGQTTTNRRDDQEISVLSLHLLQISLVYINTLMIQRVLEAPGWMERMTPEDVRALPPLIYGHVNPYGTSTWTWGSAWRSSTRRRVREQAKKPLPCGR